MIKIKSLHKRYPGMHAVKGINLNIKSGEFFALLGPNGAGKTSIIGMLTGLTTISEGSIKVDGHIAGSEQAKKKIGFVPQEFNMDIFETAYNVLHYNAQYFNVEKHVERVNLLLTELGLYEHRNKKVKELSGGMKRKLMIARALLHDPEIIILDEPTAGIDVESRKFIWKYFREANKNGKTILLTTHYIEEAEQLCNRVGVLHKGELLAIENVKDLMLKYNMQKVTLDFKTKKDAVQFAGDKYTVNNRSVTVPGERFTKMLDEFTTEKIVQVHTHDKSLEEIFLEMIQ